MLVAWVWESPSFAGPIQLEGSFYCKYIRVNRFYAQTLTTSIDFSCRVQSITLPQKAFNATSAAGFDAKASRSPFNFCLDIVTRKCKVLHTSVAVEIRLAISTLWKS